MESPSLRGIARAYLMSIGFWCAFALLMALQYRPFNHQHPWAWFTELVSEVALHGLALAFWTPPIFLLVSRYIDRAKSRLTYVLVWSLGSIPFVVLYTSMFWVLVPPYDDTLQKYLPRSFASWIDMIRGGFADEMFIYVATVVAAHGYEYLKRLRREERERYEYQQALAASELQALKMQLHPHFLFNTLHGIATLVDSEPKSAKAMIIKLSNLLRTSLDRGNTDLIPLQDELEFARKYLELEEMRFGDRLKIRWLIAPEVGQMVVPQMILQPLVENAVRHGVSSVREGGWIEIAARAENGRLSIIVRNSVGGKSSNGTGVGLRNARARLKYLYSEDASLLLSVAEDRTATATVSLPALHSQLERTASPKTANSAKEPLCEFSSSTTNH